MPRKPKGLQQEVCEFFSVETDGRPTYDRPEGWQWGDGKSAGPFIKRLLRAARLQDTIDEERRAREGKGG